MAQEAAASLLTAPDAERLVEGLTSMPLVEVGTKAWLRQHKQLQQLNIQAHSNAQRSSDPFVMESVLTFNKLPVLVHELLVAEAWAWRVLPLVKERIAARNSMRAYFAAYQEAVIINMLEVFMYHDYAAEALGDSVVDLIDFCMRKVTFLVRKAMTGGFSEEEFQDQIHGGNVGAAAVATSGAAVPTDASPEARAAAISKATAAATAAIEAEGTGSEAALRSLDRQAAKMNFGIGTAALGVLRYLCEHITKLPLSAMTRMLDTHDVPLAMVPLIENPPWTKRASSGVWYKHQNHTWSEVPPADLLKLTALEGQPWLALYNILCDKDCRGKYAMHAYRRGAIMRVRKYMHDVLLDQLPLLSGLQRYLDEVQVTQASGAAAPGTTSAAAEVPSMFVLEVQPDIHDTVVRTALAAGALQMPRAKELGLVGEEETKEGEEGSWAGVAAAILSNGFAAPDAGDTSLLSIADLYSSDLFEEVVHSQGEGILGEAGEESDGGEVDSDDEPVAAEPSKVQVLG